MNTTGEPVGPAAAGEQLTQAFRLNGLFSVLVRLSTCAWMCDTGIHPRARTARIARAAL